MGGPQGQVDNGGQPFTLFLRPACKDVVWSSQVLFFGMLMLEYVALLAAGDRDGAV
jgi:hypothetical protein